VTTPRSSMATIYNTKLLLLLLLLILYYYCKYDDSDDIHLCRHRRACLHTPYS
jgi:hypothetical protein